MGVRSCPAGGAVVSAGGNLPARWVIHAVGPVWHGGGDGEVELLASAYTTSLRLADELGAASITFPAISTGAFGYPADLAAEVAVRTLARALRTTTALRRATLVAFSGDGLETLAAALRRARIEG
jgi:O-acetyl-ADP-ribose deacetylase